MQLSRSLNRYHRYIFRDYKCFLSKGQVMPSKQTDYTNEFCREIFVPPFYISRILGKFILYFVPPANNGFLLSNNKANVGYFYCIFVFHQCEKTMTVRIILMVIWTNTRMIFRATLHRSTFRFLQTE